MRAVDSQIRPDLIDTMMDIYCEWRTECKEVQAAYQRLSRADASDRPAALDREESACRAYAAFIHLLTSKRTAESRPFPRRGEDRCR
jgi:hypothetical protein